MILMVTKGLYRIHVPKRSEHQSILYVLMKGTELCMKSLFVSLPLSRIL